MVLPLGGSEGGDVGGSVLTLGAEPGDRLWLAADFERRLSDRLKNITVTFGATGSGRTGSLQHFVTSVAGCYRIEAGGASGGTAKTGVVGGRGARMSGSFRLARGAKLTIVVGQRGGDSSQTQSKAGTGGGGGSFVVHNSEGDGGVLQLASGGGGGGSGSKKGAEGESSTSGSKPTGSSCKGQGGSDGQPGAVYPDYGSNHGGPGAGWLGGANLTQLGPEHGEAGGGQSEGWIGGLGATANSGAVGGFGGGGGGAQSAGASGGGGGFSGGGAGVSDTCGGGGGGSFCGGGECFGSTGGNNDTEQGFVAVQFLGGGC